jgi:SAM-dependent methyltransferase
MSTYSTHAAICAKFYDLTLSGESVSKFVFEKSESKPGDAGLFVGGMFEVAKGLCNKGVDLTVVDYTDEMVAVGKAKLPGVRVEKADLRHLSYEGQFDIVFVVGRVFTHMISQEDLFRGLSACRRSLRPGGRLFFDNYEDSKIQVTSYFNGTAEAGESDTLILRKSSTTRVSESPYVVRWDAEYSGTFEGEKFSFSDSMDHRAFSRMEVCRLLPDFGFEVLVQGDNFDETSFFTLARAK